MSVFAGFCMCVCVSFSLYLSFSFPKHRIVYLPLHIVHILYAQHIIIYYVLHAYTYNVTPCVCVCVCVRGRSFACACVTRVRGSVTNSLRMTPKVAFAVWQPIRFNRSVGRRGPGGRRTPFLGVSRTVSFLLSRAKKSRVYRNEMIIAVKKK